MKNLIIICLFSIGLLACGGGGGSSSEQPEPAPTDTTQVVQTDTSTNEVKTTAELVSTPEFTFTGNFELTVVIGKQPEGSVQHYINICGDYQVSGEQYLINYDTCLLRTFMSADVQMFQLSLSESQTRLVAQVWPMENDVQPINILWFKQSNENTWYIEY